MYLSAIVETSSGLTGLLSNIRSISSMTGGERRGSNCNACKFR